jgi:hypothetical protein
MNTNTCEPLHPQPCSSISGGPQDVGDTRLLNYMPAYAFETFLKTGTKNLSTHLSRAFFSKENILYITSQISAVLKHMTQENVHVPFNDELVQTMVDVMSNNIGLTYVPGAVAIVNRMVVEHEATILYNSLIRKKLWIKYYLTQDRIKVFPYGEMTKETRGESTVSPSGYMLSSPWSRHRAAYLKQTEGIRTFPDGTHENIPGYLQPKKVPMGPRRASQPAFDMGTVPPSALQCYAKSLHSQVFPENSATSNKRNF